KGRVSVKFQPPWRLCGFLTHCSKTKILANVSCRSFQTKHEPLVWKAYSARLEFTRAKAKNTCRKTLTKSLTIAKTRKVKYCKRALMSSVRWHLGWLLQPVIPPTTSR